LLRKPTAVAPHEFDVFNGWKVFDRFDVNFCEFTPFESKYFSSKSEVIRMRGRKSFEPFIYW